MVAIANTEPTILLSHVEAWRVHDALKATAYLVEEMPALDDQVKAIENHRVADLLVERIHNTTNDA